MQQEKYFTKAQLRQDPSISRILTPIAQKEFRQAQHARKQGVAVLASNLAFLQKMEKLEKRMEKKDKVKPMSLTQLKQEMGKHKTAIQHLEKKIAAEEIFNSLMPAAYKKTPANTPKLKTLYENHKKLEKSLRALEREISIKSVNAFMAKRGRVPAGRRSAVRTSSS